MVNIQRMYASIWIWLVSVIISSAASNVVPDSNSRCSARKYTSILNSIDDVEDLEIDVPVNIAFETMQKKRFILYLNSSSPLFITFSQNVVRKIYFNQTTNLSRNFKSDLKEILLPCALSGQYDLFVRARQRGSMKMEAHAQHPQSNWALLNRTNQINIRSQNRMRKSQMIIKWSKSKFDIHAVHYCLVINAKRTQKNFCAAVNEFVVGSMRKGNCFPGSAMDYVWQKPAERVKKIDPRITNVICTGSRTQQVLKGLTPNTTYFVDIFGVHTKRQNLTFHIAATTVKFNRTHPSSLRENDLSVEKISGMTSVSVFSFKVPSDELRPASQLRYLILPCGGSEVDAKILKQRTVVGQADGVYKPTYINMNNALPGDRYIIRVNPSNEDEVLRANKVGLAVTTGRTFNNLPELPENVTVYEVRSRKNCKSTTIAWYASPEIRAIGYCIIVFNLPNRNRSSVDSTNYCMDFGKRIMQHPQFYSIKCSERSKIQSPLETHTIFNLSPGESYLIYVTVYLIDGKALPYESLKVRMSHQCHNELYDSRESATYY
ncbi:protein NDNF [Eupeodes corollae]|uniref:protein NDNF n=1 Tax=Eupeodes corollae TaxID=290404 RepID=UPI0024921A00|nr:protein NDNF [Eupeodes corollae]